MTRRHLIALVLGSLVITACDVEIDLTQIDLDLIAENSLAETTLEPSAYASYKEGVEFAREGVESLLLVFQKLYAKNGEVLFLVPKKEFCELLSLNFDSTSQRCMPFSDDTLELDMDCLAGVSIFQKLLMQDFRISCW